MKRLAFAVGVLALGLVATAPAHADYAIVKFKSGYCRITGCRRWASPITSCTRQLPGIAAITGGKPLVSLEAKPAAGHQI